ncbi:Fc.00g047920.m01.CDS01 [Cosmosporella sp. VM-42]
MLAMIPDYDVVISAPTSGPETSSGVVQLLFSQAKVAFAGKYTNAETNSTLVLELDDEGPGLTISSWTVRGTDVVSHWLNYLSAVSSSLSDIEVSARLYPTGLEAPKEKKTAWRAAFDLGSPEDIAAADASYSGHG